MQVKFTWPLLLLVAGSATAQDAPPGSLAYPGPVCFPADVGGTGTALKWVLRSDGKEIDKGIDRGATWWCRTSVPPDTFFQGDPKAQSQWQVQWVPQWIGVPAKLDQFLATNPWDRFKTQAQFLRSWAAAKAAGDGRAEFNEWLRVEAMKAAPPPPHTYWSPTP